MGNSVAKARKLTTWITLVMFLCSTMLISVAILEFDWDRFTACFFLFGVITLLLHAFVNFEALLKQDYVNQFEELSQNGMLEITQSQLRKFSDVGKENNNNNRRTTSNARKSSNGTSDNTRTHEIS